MKTGSFWSWSLGVGLVALPLIGGCLRTAPTPPPAVASLEPTVIETDADIVWSAASSNQPPAQLSPEEATVKPLPAGFVLPPNVQLGKPLADLIRLAQVGSDEAVLLAFVTNSPNTFNPRADDLVYLKDIGVPDSVVSAMLRHDEKLKAQTAGSAPAPAAPAPYAAAPTPIPGATPPMEPPPAEPSFEYAPVDEASPPLEVTYPEYYEALAPYGAWVVVDGYGYCWQPAVCGPNPGWQPYCDGGRWVYTDCGWYWMSDYTWGWAPFHYGRWFRHHRWGWCWQPDRTWGPAWVCWRHNDTHCGWAPLPPGVHYTPGGSLTDHRHQVAQLSPQHFQFVAWSHFRDHNPALHRVPHAQATGIYNRTVVTAHFATSHGRVINDGLAPDRVAAATHTTVTRVTLRDVTPTATRVVHADRLDATGQTLSVYRPQPAPAPVNVARTPARVPPTKPLATPTPSAVTTPSATFHSGINGAGSLAPVAPARPAARPTTTSQPHWPAAAASQVPSQLARRQEPAQVETPAPSPAPQGQSSPESHTYQAGSRYYPAPGSPSANQRQNSAAPRFESPKGAAQDVPPASPPGTGQWQRNQPQNAPTRFQVPAAAAPEGPRQSPPPVVNSPPAAARHNREAAPVERPARVEAAESRASHFASPPSQPESRASRSAPAVSSPAPAPSRSSSPDRSASSDRSSSSSSNSSSNSRGRR